MTRVFASLLAIIAIAAPAFTTPGSVPELREIAAPPILARPVTLYVPDFRPITLAEALQAIGRQTGALLRTDTDVATDIRFSGRFTRTPLSLVLESLAKTGAFKWYAERDGTVRIAPHDDLRILLRAQQLSGEACLQCRRPLESSWRYCPWCGHAVVAPKRAESTPASR
jgi:hypothetical protein